MLGAHVTQKFGQTRLLYLPSKSFFETFRGSGVAPNGAHPVEDRRESDIIMSPEELRTIQPSKFKLKLFSTRGLDGGTSGHLPTE